MAQDNRTYYNRRGNQFTGMFDSGPGSDFVPVDWGKITGDIVSTLRSVEKERQAKRDDIQTKTDELLTDLRDYQAGGNNTFNGYVLDGSTQVKDYMLMQNKLLKQGKLDPNAYTRSSQLLQDDWNSFQEAAKTFNADYAAAIEAVNAGDASKLALMSFDEMQAATDIQNSRLVINTDGRLYSQTGNGKLVGFTNMNARQKDLPKNYNIVNGAKGFSSTLGKFKEAYPKMTVEDITAQPDFLKARDTYIEGVLNQGTGRDFLSILTQNGYELTQDPNKVDDNTILVKADSNGLLQPDKESLEKHRGRAKEILQEAISVQLDYLESPGGTETSTDQANNSRLQKIQNVYGYLGDILSNDKVKRDRAKQFLFQNYQAITGFESDTEGIRITTNTGDTQKITWEDLSGEGVASVKTPEQIIDRLLPIITGQLDKDELDKIKNKYLANLDEQGKKNFRLQFGRNDDYDINEQRTSGDFEFPEDVLTTVSESLTELGKILPEAREGTIQKAIARNINDALIGVSGIGVEASGQNLILKLPNNTTINLGDPLDLGGAGLLKRIQDEIKRSKTAKPPASGDQGFG